MPVNHSHSEKYFKEGKKDYFWLLVAVKNMKCGGIFVSKGDFSEGMI